MFKVMPKVLEDFLQKAFISMTGSLTQFFIFGSLGTTGCSWLVVKEYNHYWIIFTLATTHSQTVLGAGGHSLALWLHGIWLGCGPDGPVEVKWHNHINQFYCDFMPLSRLACSDPGVSGPGDNTHSFIVWLSHYSFWTDSDILCLDCSDGIGRSCCGQQEKGSPTWWEVFQECLKKHIFVYSLVPSNLSMVPLKVRQVWQFLSVRLNFFILNSIISLLNRSWIFYIKKHK